MEKGATSRTVIEQLDNVLIIIVMVSAVRRE